ncbi:MAG: aspartate kinase [Sphingobacteriales bacterium]|jgi:aspartate kinase|nr:MAG: aspartate kinase [Sphingobacteriales bacterium]
MFRVFKFGGASVKDASGIKNVASIVEKNDGKNLIIVVSATGKTTNALEEVVEAYFNKTGNAKEKFDIVKQNHLQICKELFDDKNDVFNQLQNVFSEVEWQLEEDRMDSYNYVYDQIVSQGEMLSSIILSAYIKQIGIKNSWLDVRDIIKTDDTYREAVVDWIKTAELTNDKVVPMLKDNVIVTQGFLGCTPENCTTTLGREGSDYTAAIFANLINAEHQTIWKDVPGVMNGDPRVFDDAVFLEQISYNEAVEMTFYGATVIHPKTIKPLQNKNIPLHVRSFIHPEGVGTIVGNTDQSKLPPIRIVKNNQSLMMFTTKDFSFIQEDILASVFRAFSKANLKLNMMQQGAISFEAVVENNKEKIQKVAHFLQENFNIETQENLSILTIRHYNDEAVAKHTASKNIILTQKTPTTFQCLVK